jgi:hypothetical protein
VKPAALIPAELQNKVGPDVPRKLRLLVARAQLPMPPSQLGVALAILARDQDQELAEAAAASLRDVPRTVMHELADSHLHGEILDTFARLLSHDLNVLRSVLRNESSIDSTIVWMAKTLRGPILMNIGANQRRYLREPDIVNALIHNPATSTPTCAIVLETYIRNGNDISQIPGAVAMAEGFFGDLDDLKMGNRARSATQELMAEGPGIDDRVVEELITRGSEAKTSTEQKDTEAPEEADTSPTPARKPVEKEPDEERGTLFNKIQKMNMAQKVRLAMLGDVNARKLLIRDPKKTISTAVLKSPRLTDKEIATYAKNKALHEDIIRTIAKKRKWTRNYATKLALLHNPKCPPNMALTFLKSLRKKDILAISRAKGVPAHVVRQAKAIIEKEGG